MTASLFRFFNLAGRLVGRSPNDRASGEFEGSIPYWESRYAAGGNSGKGSQGILKGHKAEVFNTFVKQHRIASVIEFGCGDGNQLSQAEYPAYIGLDVSREAVRRCIERFGEDSSKSFYLYDPTCFCDRGGRFRAELALSVDVVYHLVEEEIFRLHFQHLFAAAGRYVIVYSSNEERNNGSAHVHHRCFTDHVARHFPKWTLVERMENKYSTKVVATGKGPPADFYVFGRKVHE